MEESIYQNLWERTTREYVIITDLERNILDAGDNVSRLFKDADSPSTCKEKFAKARNKEILSYRGRRYQVEVTHIDKYYSVIFRECTKELEMETQIKSLEKLAQNYEMLFDNFGDSSMYVTDGKGITIWAGRAVAETCGVLPEYLIGKSIYELEEEGIFYPSITSKVLDSLNYETTVQNTAKGIQAIAMGFPLFDKNNHLVKVMSFSKPVRQKGQHELSTGIDYEPDIFYPEIVSVSSAMAEVKNRIEIFSKVDTSVIIYGESGSGKENVAKCIHKLSRRCQKSFISMNTKELKENEMMENLFGDHDDSGGKLYQADGGTLYISNLFDLPYEVQNRLFGVMKGEPAWQNGKKGDCPDVRYIAGSTKKVDVENAPHRHCRFLGYMFSALEIEVPPLRRRRDDILPLLRYFQNTFKIRYDTECAFTPEAIQALYAYEWKENAKELKQVVQEAAIKSSGKEYKLIDVNELPTRILDKEEQESCQTGFVLNEVIALDEAVQRVEKYLIQMAVKESRNAKDAAVLLGVNQSTLSRRMHKYGIVNCKNEIDFSS